MSSVVHIPRIVVVAGKGGGDFVALEAAKKEGLLDYKMAGLVATSVDSSALRVYSDNYGKQALVIRDYGKNRSEGEKRLLDYLTEKNPDFVLLSGFTFLLPKEIISRFTGRIINSHHSVLPAHPGLFKKEKLLESGDKFIGATLHIVDEGMDTGKILFQSVFPNPGIRDLPLALKLYRFAQDCMIVQWMSEVTGVNTGDRIRYVHGILFEPEISVPVIRYFEARHSIQSSQNS